MEQKLSNSAFGIGITAIFESQIFPFMLSSAFTARTAVHNQNQVDDVKTDIWISVAISEVFSIIMSFLLKDTATFVFGSVFAFALLLIYRWRGNLL